MRLIVPFPEPEGPSMVSTGALLSMGMDYGRVRRNCRSAGVFPFKLLIGLLIYLDKAS
jgi:hypothetical protein